MFKFWSRIFWC